MKKISKKSILAIVLAGCIILAGIITVVLAGYNFSLEYRKHTRIEVYIGKQFEMKDIKQITDEIFGNQEIILKKIEVFQNSLSIQVEQATEEQKELLKNKMKEKYGIEEETFIATTQPENVRGRDILKPYLIPMGATALVAILYFVVRFRKIGIFHIILVSLISLIGMQGVYFSIIAITRIPITNLFMPIALLVYMLTLIGLASYFRKSKITLDTQDKTEKE